MTAQQRMANVIIITTRVLARGTVCSRTASPLASSPITAYSILASSFTHHYQRLPSLIFIQSLDRQLNCKKPRIQTLNYNYRCGVRRTLSSYPWCQSRLQPPATCNLIFQCQSVHVCHTYATSRWCNHFSLVQSYCVPLVYRFSSFVTTAPTCYTLQQTKAFTACLRETSFWWLPTPP